MFVLKAKVLIIMKMKMVLEVYFLIIFAIT